MAAELQDFKINGKRSAFGGQRLTFTTQSLADETSTLIGFEEERLEYADERPITARQRLNVQC